MRNIFWATVVLLFINNPILKAQDLLSMLDSDSTKIEYATATFKSTHLIIGQSIENVAGGDLNVIISHHFGQLNSGAGNFWGLDQPTMRLGLEFGINNRIEVGVGRSTYKKTIDAYLKYKVVRQSTKMPLAISYFGSMAINTLPWSDINRTNYFTSRLSFVNQLLIARKFNESFSLQLMPTYVHKNLVKRVIDENDAMAIGAGGRIKLTKRMSLNAEYYYLLPGQTAKDHPNSLSLGFDVETGGHVFQLFFTNSNPLFERGFITETAGKWQKGDICFGFNIIRTFNVITPKEFRKKK